MRFSSFFKPKRKEEEPKQWGYLDDAYDIYFRNTDAAAENRFERALWSSWGTTAVFVEGGLTALPGFDAPIDSLDKARNLVNLFIQPMVSTWFHNWESQEEHSDQEKDEARRVAFENVQAFLGIRSQESIHVVMCLDKELQLCLAGERGSSAYYGGMFHTRYRECVTGENIVEWNGLRVPITSWVEFLASCNKATYQYLDPDASAVLFSLIVDAGVRMLKEFTRAYGGR